MATEPHPVPEDASYGELLGAYVSVVAEASRLLDGFGRPPPEERARYDRLRARKAAIRERLSAADASGDPDGYRSLIDEAASTERRRRP